MPTPEEKLSEYERLLEEGVSKIQTLNKEVQTKQKEINDLTPFVLEAQGAVKALKEIVEDS
jgi:hypothetical protein